MQHVECLDVSLSKLPSAAQSAGLQGTDWRTRSATATGLCEPRGTNTLSSTRSADFSVDANRITMSARPPTAGFKLTSTSQSGSLCRVMVRSHLTGELRYGPLGRGLGAHASCDWLVAICAQNAKIVRPESKFVENS